MLERRNNQGYLYLLPWIIGFLIFQLYPIAMSLYYSFTDYSFGNQYDFVGLANYLQIFTKDREVKNSLAVTFKFVFMSVPMKLISALDYCNAFKSGSERNRAFQNDLLSALHSGRKRGDCHFMETFI